MLRLPGEQEKRRGCKGLKRANFLQQLAAFIADGSDEALR